MARSSGPFPSTATVTRRRAGDPVCGGSHLVGPLPPRQFQTLHLPHLPGSDPAGTPLEKGVLQLAAPWPAPEAGPAVKEMEKDALLPFLYKEGEGSIRLADTQAPGRGCPGHRFST